MVLDPSYKPATLAEARRLTLAALEDCEGVKSCTVNEGHLEVVLTMRHHWWTMPWTRWCNRRIARSWGAAFQYHRLPAGVVFRVR